MRGRDSPVPAIEWKMKLAGSSFGKSFTAALCNKAKRPRGVCAPGTFLIFTRKRADPQVRPPMGFPFPPYKNPGREVPHKLRLTASSEARFLQGTLFPRASAAAAAGAAIAVTATLSFMVPPQGPNGQGRHGGQRQQNRQGSKYFRHSVRSFCQVSQARRAEAVCCRSSLGCRYPLRPSKYTTPASRARAATVPGPKAASPVNSPPS